MQIDVVSRIGDVHSEREAGSDTSNARRLLWAIVKRCFDVALAALLLLAVLPLLALIAVLIKLDSPGPVLFRQTRYGLGLTPFRVMKLRTMRADASPELHRRYIAQLARGDVGNAEGLKKLCRDPRVTRAGGFLRKTSLDELPQLFNVLRGEMSIVGPRPAIEYELEHYEAAHFDRFQVRPGITGLWQVSGRSQVGFVEMLELDAEYARSHGFVRDAVILVRTPLAVFGRRAA